MGNSPIAGLQQEQRIGRRHQCTTVARGYRRSASHAECPPPQNFAVCRIDTQCLTMLREGNQGSIDKRERGADGRGRNAPDLLPGGDTQGGDSSLRSGAGGVDGIAGNQDASHDHPRQARGPAHVATGEIHRVDLPIDAAAVQGVVPDLDRIGKPPARLRRPYWGRGIAGNARRKRCRWRSEVYAGCVDASQQQG